MLCSCVAMLIKLNMATHEHNMNYSKHFWRSSFAFSASVKPIQWHHWLAVSVGWREIMADSPCICWASLPNGPACVWAACSERWRVCDVARSRPRNRKILPLFADQCAPSRCASLAHPGCCRWHCSRSSDTAGPGAPAPLVRWASGKDEDFRPDHRGLGGAGRPGTAAPAGCRFEKVHSYMVRNHHLAPLWLRDSPLASFLVAVVGRPCCPRVCRAQSGGKTTMKWMKRRTEKMVKGHRVMLWDSCWACRIKAGRVARNSWISGHCSFDHCERRWQSPPQTSLREIQLSCSWGERWGRGPERTRTVTTWEDSRHPGHLNVWMTDGGRQKTRSRAGLQHLQKRCQKQAALAGHQEVRGQEATSWPPTERSLQENHFCRFSWISFKNSLDKPYAASLRSQMKSFRSDSQLLASSHFTPTMSNPLSSVPNCCSVSHLTRTVGDRKPNDSKNWITEHFERDIMLQLCLYRMGGIQKIFWFTVLWMKLFICAV